MPFRASSFDWLGALRRIGARRAVEATDERPRGVEEVTHLEIEDRARVVVPLVELHPDEPPTAFMSITVAAGGAGLYDAYLVTPGPFGTFLDMVQPVAGLAASVYVATMAPGQVLDNPGASVECFDPLGNRLGTTLQTGYMNAAVTVYQSNQRTILTPQNGDHLDWIGCFLPPGSSLLVRAIIGNQPGNFMMQLREPRNRA